MHLGIVSIGSHSLSYAYDSLYMAYLKSHYPLEFYTVSLNFYQGDFERTNRLTQELEYFKIKISSPKFRYSFGEYSCDKNTNTIYKGISSIKGLSKTIGDKLYSLKDKNYPTFLDLLIDCKEQKIGISDLTVLAKLDYFSEFGTIGKILKFLDIYNELYGKKTIKKDKEYLVKKLYLKQFCAKETDKQYSGFDSYKCLSDLIDKIPNEDISTYAKLKYQLEYYGYVNIIDENIDRSYWFVSDITPRGNNQILDLYKINTGTHQQTKIRNKIFQTQPFNKGDTLNITLFSQEGKWIKDEEGKWKQSNSDKEYFINEYSMIKGE